MNKHFFLFILLFPLLSLAQSSSSLRIGDTVPADAFTSLTKQAGIPLNSKLLILDFWSTWCTSCLQGFPKLEALQQQFSNELQVVLVNAKATGDNAKKINTFFTKRKNSKGLPYNFSSIAEDTVFSQLFTHKLIPHYVWIDHNRIVRAITGPEEITAENIASFLAGTASTLRLKNDLDFDLAAPLFVNNNGGTGANILYRSILTGYSPGLPAFIGKSQPGDTTARIYATNASVELLYKLAFPELNLVPANRIILRAHCPEQYRVTGDINTWKYDHAYTYELNIPTAQAASLDSYMQKDLQRYFGMQLFREKLDTECYVLTKNTNSLQAAIKKQNTKIKKPGKAATQTITVTMLIKDLDHHISIPVLNETGLSDYQLIPLTNISDIKTIRQQLEQQGFNLQPACRLIDVYTLTEKNYNPANNKQ